MPRETLVAPSVDVMSPTCLTATVEVVTLKAGLTVWPAGMKTDAGTLAPVMSLERVTVTPPGGRALLSRLARRVLAAAVKTCFASSTF